MIVVSPPFLSLFPAEESTTHSSCNRLPVPVLRLQDIFPFLTVLLELQLQLPALPPVFVYQRPIRFEAFASRLAMSQHFPPILLLVLSMSRCID